MDADANSMVKVPNEENLPGREHREARRAHYRAALDRLAALATPAGP